MNHFCVFSHDKEMQHVKVELLCFFYLLFLYSYNCSTISTCIFIDTGNALVYIDVRNIPCIMRRFLALNLKKICVLYTSKTVFVLNIINFCDIRLSIFNSYSETNVSFKNATLYTHTDIDDQNSELLTKNDGEEKSSLFFTYSF